MAPFGLCSGFSLSNKYVGPKFTRPACRVAAAASDRRDRLTDGRDAVYSGALLGGGRCRWLVHRATAVESVREEDVIGRRRYLYRCDRHRPPPARRAEDSSIDHRNEVSVDAPPPAA